MAAEVSQLASSSGLPTVTARRPPPSTNSTAGRKGALLHTEVATVSRLIFLQSPLRLPDEDQIFIGRAAPLASSCGGGGSSSTSAAPANERFLVRTETRCREVLLHHAMIAKRGCSARLEFSAVLSALEELEGCLSLRFERNIFDNKSDDEAVDFFVRISLLLADAFEGPATSQPLLLIKASAALRLHSQHTRASAAAGPAGEGGIRPKTPSSKQSSSSDQKLRAHVEDQQQDEQDNSSTSSACQRDVSGSFFALLRMVTSANLGIFYRRAGKHFAALRYFEKAHRLAQLLGPAAAPSGDHSQLQSRVALGLAALLPPSQSRRSLDLSQKACSAISQRLHQSNMKSILARRLCTGLHNVAVVQVRSGNFRDGQVNAIEALRLAGAYEFSGSALLRPKLRELLRATVKMNGRAAEGEGGGGEDHDAGGGHQFFPQGLSGCGVLLLAEEEWSSPRRGNKEKQSASFRFHRAVRDDGEHEQQKTKITGRAPARPPTLLADDVDGGPLRGASSSSSSHRRFSTRPGTGTKPQRQTETQAASRVSATVPPVVQPPKKKSLRPSTADATAGTSNTSATRDTVCDGGSRASFTGSRGRRTIIAGSRPSVAISTHRRPFDDPHHNTSSSHTALRAADFLFDETNYDADAPAIFISSACETSRRCAAISSVSAQVRRWKSEDRKVKIPHRGVQEKAATRIQAVVRGWLVRQWTKLENRATDRPSCNATLLVGVDSHEASEHHELHSDRKRRIALRMASAARQADLQQKAASTLQSFVRGHTTREKISANLRAVADASAVVLQRAWRGFLARNELHVRHVAATLLQTTYRRWRCVKVVAPKKRESIRSIQKQWRGFAVRTWLRRRDCAAVCVQKCWRRFLVRRGFRWLLRSIRRIQNASAGRRQRNIYRRMQSCATTIQYYWRAQLDRRNYIRLRTAAIRLQHLFRTRLRDRLRDRRGNRAASRIQHFWCRNNAEARRGKNDYQRFWAALVTLQTRWRYCRTRRATLAVQRAVRQKVLAPKLRLFYAVLGALLEDEDAGMKMNDAGMLSKTRMGATDRDYPLRVFLHRALRQQKRMQGLWQSSASASDSGRGPPRFHLASTATPPRPARVVIVGPEFFVGSSCSREQTDEDVLATNVRELRTRLLAIVNEARGMFTGGCLGNEMHDPQPQGGSAPAVDGRAHHHNNDMVSTTIGSRMYSSRSFEAAIGCDAFQVVKVADDTTRRRHDSDGETYPRKLQAAKDEEWAVLSPSTQEDADIRFVFVLPGRRGTATKAPSPWSSERATHSLLYLLLLQFQFPLQCVLLRPEFEMAADVGLGGLTSTALSQGGRSPLNLNEQEEAASSSSMQDAQMHFYKAGQWRPLLFSTTTSILASPDVDLQLCPRRIVAAIAVEAVRRLTTSTQSQAPAEERSRGSAGVGGGGRLATATHYDVAFFQQLNQVCAWLPLAIRVPALLRGGKGNKNNLRREDDEDNIMILTTDEGRNAFRVLEERTVAADGEQLECASRRGEKERREEVMKNATIETHTNKSNYRYAEGALLPIAFSISVKVKEHPEERY